MKSVFTSLFTLFFCFYSHQVAASPTGEAILKGLNMREAEIRSLENGEVVTKLASEYEQSKRELAIDATVLINKPLDVLVEESEDDLTLIPGKMILDSREVFGEADFDSVGFSPDELEEARAFLKAGRNDKLNLGMTDLDIVQAVKQQAAGRGEIELASEIVRKILARRYREYKKSGLAGIEPYVRKGKGKTVSVGHELKLSNEQLFGIDQYFPEYLETLVHFPRGADCCEHRFMWMKAKVNKRPTFILIHRIVLDADQAVLLTERHFYISNSLNSLQLTLGWLPYSDASDSTYLGIATSANSDYLTGLTGKLIRTLGANKGAKMIGGVLEDIRDDLEAGRSPKEGHE